MLRIKLLSIFKILLLHLHLFHSINAAPSAITDIDKCMEPGICSQFCSNEEGGFKCSCDVGYLTDPEDSTRCKAAEGRASLLVANRHDIRQIAFDGQEITIIVNTTGYSYALDFVFRTGMIFWSDTMEEKIYKARIGKGNERTVVIDSVRAYGLAVDWIHNHIYWTDYDSKTIQLANFEGNMSKTVINDCGKSRAIAVDPLEGWMFWTKPGADARIERAGMDGSHRSTIIDTDVEVLYGITLDLVGKKLYWMDQQLSTIESCNYDGSGRRTILHSHNLSPYAFGITTFEDHIYWMDWKWSAILKANKFNGNEVEPITPLGSVQHAMPVHVYHPYRQPHGTNQCQAVNQHCSHLFLPAPRFDSKSPPLRCACPDGLRLSSDGLTCVGQFDSKSEILTSSAETADVRKEVGQFAAISCLIPVNCATDLEWIKIGHPEKTNELKSMTSELRFDSVMEMTLNFTQVKHDDNGTYACVGPNDKRFNGTERTLTVTDVPEVTITVAEPTSNGEIYLKWTVIDTHNEPVIDYTIEYQKQDQHSEWKVYADHAAAENTTIYLQGLEIGASYRLRVSATNSVGKSLPYAYPHCITTMFKDTEYVPRISVDNKTDDSIIISLEPPPEDLKENNYIYKLRIAGGNESAEQSSTTDLNQRTISFRNLESGITYRIKASACLDWSTEKCGRWSEEEVQTLNEDSKAEELTTSENNIHFHSVPKVTTITPARAIAAGEVHLNWTVNAVEDTDLEIRGYYKLRTVAKNFADTFHRFMSTIMRTIQ